MFSLVNTSKSTETNSSLGTGAIGGMLIGTIALLFIVPTLYVVFEYFQEKLTPLKTARGVSDRIIRKEKKNLEKEIAKNKENEEKNHTIHLTDNNYPPV